MTIYIGWSLLIGSVFLAAAALFSIISISPLFNIKEFNVAVISVFYIIGKTINQLQQRLEIVMEQLSVV